MRAWSRRLVMVAVMALVLPGAALAQSFATFPKSKVEIVTQAGKRHAFAVEVATSYEQLAQGLMYRRSLAADAGMLFDFGENKQVTMWMKNTLIPLDMVFLGADGKVVGVHERAVPGSLETITSPGAVKGVLELNGGTAERLGIKPGDRVLHPLFGR